MSGGGRPAGGRFRRSLLLTPMFLGLAARLAAQHGAPGTDAIAEAARTITPAEVTRHLAMLAAESLQGRTTPSPALERTARYLAAQFEQLGLRPGGDDGRWLQRYAVPERLRLNYRTSELVFVTPVLVDGQVVRTEQGELEWPRISVSLAGAARLLTPVVPGHGVSGRAILLAGRQSSAAIARLNVQGRVMLYVPPAEIGTDTVAAATRDSVLAQLIGQGAAGIVVLVPADSATFAARRAAPAPAVTVRDRTPRPAAAAPPWVAEVRADALDAVLAAAEFDLTALLAARTPIQRDLPQMRVDLLPEIDRTEGDATTAPNVVAVLEGRDSVLKHQAIVISAHMDQPGLAAPAAPDPGSADRATVVDNTTGLVGLLALARALGQPEARPRRSVILLATSGAASGFAGSSAYVKSYSPERRFVFDLTLDLAAGPMGDSVLIDGAEDVELALSPAWIAAQHPELQLRLVPGGTVVDGTSDHAGFVRAGLPSLYLHTGTPETDTAATPASARVPSTAPVAHSAEQADRTARILQLVFYLSRAIAEADRQPRWSGAGRHRWAGTREP